MGLVEELLILFKDSTNISIVIGANKESYAIEQKRTKDNIKGVG